MRTLLTALIVLCTVVTAQAEQFVVCVGDSNTQRGYPKILAGILGEGWTAQNCGKGGTTMLNGTKRPYLACKQYKQFQASEPDYVVIMLGSNDANPTWWSGERTSKFEGSSAEEFEHLYRDLINEARNLPSKPQVLVATPVPFFPHKSPRLDLVENRKQGSATLSNTIIPLIKKIAEDEKVTLVDIHTGMQNQEATCIDGIHYNKAGYTKLSEIIAAEILKLNAE